MPKMLALWCIAALTILGAASCSKAPTAEIEAADSAMESARVAEAADYAPDSMKAAEEARAGLDAELKAQEDRFALTRSYKRAKELAATSKAAAEKAAADAVEGRERTREEAANLISEVKVLTEEVKGLIAKAPRGKGSEIDIAMMKSDVSAIESSLVEMDDAFAAERFFEAKTKAQAAWDSAQQIKDDILQAVEKAKRTRSRSS